ncbi:MAG TPA: SEC59/DGK1/VTE5 family protein [Candidatus Kapabacteria bacterium]|jgi:dolichol kinase|nr:SEC59/DGK1/VTE5 family protein [Candidatus Kapabacteria bacterium]HOQ48890.1 SEC59/DGK1/VTE5 family protein [Candidatus Kapabacteria bacterium]HPP40459.1 SEC59/DGK1/VTE5 family protein [Candidatus Kapabacteria bacterium]HPU23784.1 SEC59/DGK1/VTE5 family protein [Candidatus Kapabacteria bacterium]
MNTTKQLENNLDNQLLIQKSQNGNGVELENDKKHKEQIPYHQEVVRKLIHLCSLSIPIGYIFVERKTAIVILFVLAVLMVTIDISTKKNEFLRKIYKQIFGGILRKHERKKKKILLNGASWVLISAVITILIFPKIIAVTAFTILIVSDIAAALIGRKFGRHRLFNKSWEGTIAFIATAIAAVFVLGFSFDAPVSYFIAGSLGAVAGGFAEASSKKLKMDDNFVVPMSIGIIMLAFSTFATPYLQDFLHIL